MPAEPTTTAYVPRRLPKTWHADIRGLRMQVHEWGDRASATAARPSLVLMHGWMDVAASFQFVVDELAAIEGPVRHVVAADWRGFGGSMGLQTDSYWFPDYLGDLDGLLALLSPQAPVDLLGHSMGGNVVMSYAGVRPERIRRLMNLEGFGLPATESDEAPKRLRRWLDELREPARLRDYANVGEVAERLRANNPRLSADKAAWLAAQWAQPQADGRWHVLGDPAHKRPNPVPYRVDEVLATWRCITAPVLWVEGEATRLDAWYGQRYPREEFERRLAVLADLRQVRLADAAHMLHHDQPAALARALAGFLG